jgi:prepilin-type N-terminal cleavage/methylation domain-containing protein
MSQSHSGVTLIEVIVALALLALMAALVTVSPRLTKLAIVSAQDSIVTAMRREAVVSGRPRTARAAVHRGQLIIALPDGRVLSSVSGGPR